jgi:hypothetical protein
MLESIIGLADKNLDDRASVPRALSVNENP